MIQSTPLTKPKYSAWAGVVSIGSSIIATSNIHTYVQTGQTSEFALYLYLTIQVVSSSALHEHRDLVIGTLTCGRLQLGSLMRELRGLMIKPVVGSANVPLFG
jgi:hypothetical protein